MPILSLSHEELLTFRENMFRDLRVELGQLKTCQNQAVLFGITGAGVVLGLVKDNSLGELQPYLFLLPMIILLPYWLIFYDKGRTISRIVGFIRVQEGLGMAKSLVGGTGWESAMNEYWEKKSMWDTEENTSTLVEINNVQYIKKTLSDIYTYLVEFLYIREAKLMIIVARIRSLLNKKLSEEEIIREKKWHTETINRIKYNRKSRSEKKEKKLYTSTYWFTVYLIFFAFSVFCIFFSLYSMYNMCIVKNNPISDSIIFLTASLFFGSFILFLIIYKLVYNKDSNYVTFCLFFTAIFLLLSNLSIFSYLRYISSISDGHWLYFMYFWFFSIIALFIALLTLWIFENMVRGRYSYKAFQYRWEVILDVPEDISQYPTYRFKM